MMDGNEKAAFAKLHSAFKNAKERLERCERAMAEPIAVIGMACRFPGADSPEEFWDLLDSGRDSVTEIPHERWDVDAYYDPKGESPGKMYTRHGGFLRAIDGFDAPFFGISNLEAQAMDPQQRVLLESCWHALEDAGLAPDRLKGSRTGVIMGVGNSDYAGLARNVPDPDFSNPFSVTGVATSSGVGRISYFFGFQGINLAVDTACSSSLASVHLAVRSLRNGESDLVLAGGVNLILSPDSHLGLCTMSALSPTGRCRSFDDSADGYVRSEGCGVLVLKRLSEALRDGDDIRAVIRGSAVGQDGRSNGLTAPNGNAQHDVLVRALKEAKVDPSEVSYLETHGTGTPLGDPIEVDAAVRAYGRAGAGAGEPLWIGAVKSNIGHLEAAAGVAGMIKAVLCLEQGRIPRNLHFSRPNRNINWDACHARVVSEPVPWPRGSAPRRAGISAFGFSGTNVHVILEEAPSVPPPVADHPARLRLLRLSAHTAASLDSLVDRCIKRFRHSPGISAARVCAMADTGRATFGHRVAVVGATVADFAEGLEAFLASRHAGQGGALLDPSGKAHEASSRSDSGAEEGDPDRARLTAQARAFEAGANPDPGPTGSERGARCALPGYPFDRKSYWLPGRDGGRRPSAPYPATELQGILGRSLSSPALDGVKVYETHVSGHHPAWIGDHKLRDVLVLPGTYYVCMALAAAEQAYPGRAIEFSDIEFRLPLFAVPQKVVQVVLRRVGEEGARIGIHSRSFRESWAENASCKVSHRPEAGWEAPPVALPDRSLVACNGDRFYAEAKNRGYGFRGSFRWIRNLWRSDDGIVAELGEPAGIPVGRFGSLHPGLIDSCFQCLLFSDFGERESGSGGVEGLFVPIGAARIRFGTWDGTGPLKCRVRYTPVPGASAVKASVVLESGSGRVLEVDDAVFARMDKAAMGAVAGSDRGPEAYELKWRPAPEPSLDAAEGKARPWFILSGDPEAARGLQAALAGKGWATSIAPLQSDPWSPAGEQGIDPFSPGDFRRAVGQWRLASGASPVGVILLRTERERSGREESGFYELFKRENAAYFHLGRALADSGGAASILSLDCRADGAADAALAYPPTWGLGNTLMQEAPDLECRWIESLGQDWEAAAEEILATDGEPLVLRSGRRERRIARLEPDRLPKAAEVRSDCTYLITGGTGALGQLVAARLVDMGARNLALVGRRIAGSEKQAYLPRLLASGGKCKSYAFEFGSGDDFSDLLREMSADLPPIRGIVHLAGATDDAPMAELDWPRFRHALLPKARAAWDLHEASSRLDLDFFVMFSSLASVMGSFSQASYAVANSFLDCLAHFRKAGGLPALSINWGPWADVGMASQNPALDRKLHFLGLRKMAPQAAVDLFAAALGHARPQVAVMEYAAGRTGPAASVSRILATAGSRRTDADAPRPAVGQLEGVRRLHPEGGNDAVRSFLASLIARLMGVPQGRIDGGTPLVSQGMDSLMSMGLRSEVRQAYGINLPLSMLVSDISLSGLADYILAEMAGTSGSGKAAPHRAAAVTEVGPQAAGRDALPDLENLSDAELSDLFDSMTRA